MDQGIAGLKALPEKMNEWWPAENVKEIARFNADCIEKFGTGGGMFRNLYLEFLRWTNDKFAGVLAPNALDLAVESSASWTELAGILYQIADGVEKSSTWDEAIGTIHRISDGEQAMFTAILNHLHELE